MSLFYGPQCGAYNCAKHLFLIADYDTSASEMNTAFGRQVFGKYKPAIDFLHRSGDLAKMPTELKQQACIRRPLPALAESYVACLAAAFC